MKSYTVTYEMSIAARDPEEAAREAWEMLQDPASWEMPPILGVRDNSTGEEQDIDLTEDEGLTG